MGNRILAINPGSTSTKIAIYNDETLLYEKTLQHAKGQLETYATIIDQYPYRKEVVLAAFKESTLDINTLNAVVGRGGMLKPLSGGTYTVNKAMLKELREAKRGEHASNLGAILAFEIAQQVGCQAFIVDPVAVDEMEDIARISGMPGIERQSLFHALNHKAVAKRYAETIGEKYEALNLIVAHLGGGISVASHHNGRVIDVNNALDGDGPFSPERSGGVPIGPLYQMCFSGSFTLKDIQSKNYKNGGLVGYLGTNDGLEIIKRIEKGDQKAKLVFEAMAYQISKEIGSHAAVLKGIVDAVILTGGLANSKRLNTLIKDRIGFIAPLVIYQGQNEMKALAEGAIRILEKKEMVKIYE